VRRLPSLAWLVVVWCALWGEVTAANILSGVAVAAGVQLAFPSAAPRPAGGGFRPLRLLRYGTYFLYKLVESNILVAWEVITPGSRINLGVVAVPVLGASDAVVTLVANSISLTPGTLTIEVRRNPSILYVHVLHVRSVEQTRREVLYLEYLALRALAPELVGDEPWDVWCEHVMAEGWTSG
jgi:multicomponent Na+:H+ antiporter subunit E